MLDQDYQKDLPAYSWRPDKCLPVFRNPRRVKLRQYFQAAAGSNALGACIQHGRAGGPVADAAGSFNLYGIAGHLLHQPHSLRGCAARTGARARFDVIRTNQACNPGR